VFLGLDKGQHIYSAVFSGTDTFATTRKGCHAMGYLSCIRPQRGVRALVGILLGAATITVALTATSSASDEALPVAKVAAETAPLTVEQYLMGRFGLTEDQARLRVRVSDVLGNRAV